MDRRLPSQIVKQNANGARSKNLSAASAPFVPSSSFSTKKPLEIISSSSREKSPTFAHITVKMLDYTFRLAVRGPKILIVELLCQIYTHAELASELPLSYLVSMTPLGISVDKYYDEISVYDNKEIVLDYAPFYDTAPQGDDVQEDDGRVEEGLLGHLEAIKRYSRKSPELRHVHKASKLMLRYAIRLNYNGEMSVYLISLSQAIRLNWDGNEILEWNEIYKGEMNLRYVVLGNRNEQVYKDLTYNLNEFNREKNVHFIHVYMKLASVLAEKEGYPRLYFLLLPFTRETHNREGKENSELVNLSDEIDVTPRNYLFSLGHSEVSLENTLAWIKIILGHLEKKSVTYKQIRLVEKILKETEDVVEEDSELYLLLQTTIFVEKIVTKPKHFHSYVAGKVQEA